MKNKTYHPKPKVGDLLAARDYGSDEYVFGLVSEVNPAEFKVIWGDGLQEYAVYTHQAFRGFQITLELAVINGGKAELCV